MAAQYTLLHGKALDMIIKKCKRRYKENIVVTYIRKYIKARRTWKPNKEYWVVLIIMLGVMLLLYPFVGAISVVIPMFLLALIPIIIILFDF